MNVLLVGTTGVGKTTVAKDIVSRHSGWYHINSGDIARSVATKDDLLNFKRGKLMSDERLIRYKALNAINGIYYGSRDINMVLDGFPRTDEQLSFLLYALVPIHLAFWIELSFSEVSDRIKNRSRDSVDTVETAINRTINEKPILLKLWSHIKNLDIDSVWINADNMSSRDLSSLIYKYIVEGMYASTTI